MVCPILTSLHPAILEATLWHATYRDYIVNHTVIVLGTAPHLLSHTAHNYMDYIVNNIVIVLCIAHHYGHSHTAHNL